VLSPIYAAHRKAITDFAAKTSVPLIFDTMGLAAEPGALLSYGADVSALSERAAAYVDRILKGARPADLPVEQPTKFQLVINLKTAKNTGNRSITTARPRRRSDRIETQLLRCISLFLALNGHRPVGACQLCAMSSRSHSK
jgi:hypothetical protein